MAVSLVRRMQITHAAERILHTQGNYRGGNLEMAVVLDYAVSEESLRKRAEDIVTVLKNYSEVFRNVRLNVIKWKRDGSMEKELSAMAKLQAGSVFADYPADGEPVSVSREAGEHRRGRRAEELFEQLKYFYARSKLVILLTDGDYEYGDSRRIQEALQPFLYRKLMIVQASEVRSGIEMLQESRKNG